MTFLRKIVLSVSMVCIVSQIMLWNLHQPHHHHQLKSNVCTNQSIIKHAQFCDKLTVLRNLKPEIHKNGVPKLIHFLIIANNINSVDNNSIVHIETWANHNPSYQIVLWTFQSAQLMIKSEFRHRQFDLYEAFKTDNEKSLAVRNFILYRYGGVFIDNNMACHQGLSQQLEAITHNFQSSCVLNQVNPLEIRIVHGRHLSATSNLLICRPKHPFFLMMIDNLTPSRKVPEIHKIGAFYTHRIFQIYKNRHLAQEDQVILADPQFFSPFPDASTVLSSCAIVNSRPKQFTATNIKECANIADRLEKMSILATTVASVRTIEENEFEDPDLDNGIDLCTADVLNNRITVYL